MEKPHQQRAGLNHINLCFRSSSNRSFSSANTGNAVVFAVFRKENILSMLFNIDMVSSRLFVYTKVPKRLSSVCHHMPIYSYSYKIKDCKYISINVHLGMARSKAQQAPPISLIVTLMITWLITG